ncbi:serine/threonine-protein kinase [Nannocystis punicea]|uniref:Protein kinase n=1 Tax=Nannocystis punicea TaxID=2995304 RepID=A0ABY7H594_9BACT|nr:serine/threonine protein kinase [Nannocystis poenicansa]WAS94338.1 protein kinase [Nannocystis poenicansa]
MPYGLIARADPWMLAPVVTGTGEARAKVGDVLGGRWELRESIGAGGLGRVFGAWDRERRQTCAIKLFDAAAAVPAEAFRRYTEALRGAAAVSHPAVVLPQTPVVAGGPRFAVGEWLKGVDLDGLRSRGGAVQWSRAAEIVSTCADALAVVHEATGLAHRALKPGNVWICENSQVRLLDLGIAELAVSPVAPRAGGVFVEYRAPEQLEGHGGDARSDVFTLAVLLFELTTGVHPFAGQSAFKAAHRALQSTPDPSTEGLPAQAQPLLTRALARRPEDRHASAREFLRALTIVRQSVGGTAPRAAATAPANAADADDGPAPPVADSTTQLRIPVPRQKPPSAPAEAPVRGAGEAPAFAAPVAPATAEPPNTPATDEPALLGRSAASPGKPPRGAGLEASRERDARRPATATPSSSASTKVSPRTGPSERDVRQAAAKSRPEPNYVPGPPDLPTDWITTERDFRRPSVPESTMALPDPGDLSKKPGLPAQKVAAAERDVRRPSVPETTLALSEPAPSPERPSLPAHWVTTERDLRRPAAPEATLALSEPPLRAPAIDEDAATTAIPSLNPRPAKSVPQDMSADPQADEPTRALLRSGPRGSGGPANGRDAPAGLGPGGTVVLDRGGPRPVESTIALPDPKDMPPRAPRDGADAPEEPTQMVTNLAEQVRAAQARRQAEVSRETVLPTPTAKPWLSPRGLVVFNLALGALILAALAVLLTR